MFRYQKNKKSQLSCRYLKLGGLSLIGLVSPGFVLADLTYSDALTPDQPSAVESLVEARNPIHLFSVRRFENQDLLLEEELAGLPRLTPVPRKSQYGYHSAYHQLDGDSDTMDSWLELGELESSRIDKLEGIALVPALSPRSAFETGYGFPRRFKIELTLPGKPEHWVTVVDWTGADFPNPGLYPVYFAVSQPATRIRLTVTKGAVEAGRQYFALSELMVFKRGINIAPNLKSHLTVSDSFNSPPYWKPSFMIDRRTHLGPALMPSGESNVDYIRHFDQPPTEKPWVEIDLGENYGVGRIEILAGQPAAKIPIEGYGFPPTCQIEMFKSEREGSTPRWERKYSLDANSHPHWLGTFGVKARFIRLTALELPIYDGKSVFALGELRVIARDGKESRNVAEGMAVRQNGEPDDGSDPARLVDGLSDGRKIIPEIEFISNLAKAKVLNRARIALDEQIKVARAEVKWNIRAAFIVLTGFLLTGMGGWLIYQRRLRHADLQRLRQQIATDLHDEIGANLGSISMITSYLGSKVESDIQRKLMEVGHIAQESFSSVQELIWLMDETAETVGDLLEKMEETARRILIDCEVVCDFPEIPPGTSISLKTRKSVLLLFKEALYNCAKYARAKHVYLSAEIREDNLHLSIEDDGEGFDLSVPTPQTHLSGRGLKNMQQRAQLMGAGFHIHSELEKGTKIKLSLPLK